MSYSKGSRGKFTKQSTDLGTPVIARQQIITAGQAWMGASDLDNNNPESFYFHLFGGAPSSVTLFVFGDLFNQAHYTELGQHDHGPGTLATGNTAVTHQHGGTASISHTHTASTGVNNHAHSLWTGDDDGGFKIDIDGDSINNSFNLNFPVDGTGQQIMSTVTHNHSVTVSAPSPSSQGFNTSSISSGSVTHLHTVTTGLTAATGLSPGVGTLHSTGTAKQYFNALKIEIDGIDRTAPLLAQAGVAAFGDGTSGHIIVTAGIELDISAYILTPGQHKVKFSLNTLAPNNGGKVRYNLYAT